MQVKFDRREVTLDNQPVKLTPTEYDLLKYMIEHAGKVLTHRMLLHAIWGQAYIDQAQYLRVFIGQLRRKIEKTPGRPSFIITDPGVGYRFSTDQEFLCWPAYFPSLDHSFYTFLTPLRSIPHRVLMGSLCRLSEDPGRCSGPGKGAT
jgi:hypothetical protein